MQKEGHYDEMTMMYWMGGEFLKQHLLPNANSTSMSYKDEHEIRLV